MIFPLIRSVVLTRPNRNTNSNTLNWDCPEREVFEDAVPTGFRIRHHYVCGFEGTVPEEGKCMYEITE